MTYIKKATCIFLPLLLMQCDTGVDPVKLGDEVIAITSFISPQDTLITVTLSKVNFAGGSSANDPVENALVVIQSTSQADTLTYNAANRWYETRPEALSIVAGETYELSVTTATQHIWASCQVPPLPSQALITGESKEETYEFMLEWKNEENHQYYSYDISATGTYFTSRDSLRRSFLSIGDTINPVNNYPIVGEMPIISNIDYKTPADDQQLTNTIEAWIADWHYVSDATMSFKLYNIDEGLYNYLESFTKFESWRANLGNAIIAAQDQPQMYSNVENGIGVFAAHNSRTTKTVLK